jgi:hypothetical protein
MEQDRDTYRCEACEAEFESHDALRRHVYDMGLVW